MRQSGSRSRPITFFLVVPGIELWPLDHRGTKLKLLRIITAILLSNSMEKSRWETYRQTHLISLTKIRCLQSLLLESVFGQAISVHILLFRIIFILFSYICWGFPSGLLPTGFLTKILYAFLHMHHISSLLIWPLSKSSNFDISHFVTFFILLLLPFSYTQIFPHYLLSFILNK
jgi:hypothetical protein